MYVYKCKIYLYVYKYHRNYHAARCTRKLYNAAPSSKKFSMPGINNYTFFMVSKTFLIT